MGCLSNRMLICQCAEPARKDVRSLRRSGGACCWWPQLDQLSRRPSVAPGTNALKMSRANSVDCSVVRAFARGETVDSVDQICPVMRWASWWLGPLLGGIGAYSVYVLLREIWGNCRFGVNASSRGFELIFGEVTRTFFIVALASGVVYAVLRRIPVRWSVALAAFGALVTAVVAVWITVSVRHHPYTDSYDCIPPWWPSWIPL